MTVTSHANAVGVALPERAHVHDEVAAELGVDPDRLRAELADAIASPLRRGGAEQ